MSAATLIAIAAVVIGVTVRLSLLYRQGRKNFPYPKFPGEKP
jgi:hypothetical protein